MAGTKTAFEKLKSERPLVAARDAVDEAYKRQRTELRKKLDEGVKPLKLYDKTFDAPDVDVAEELLREVPATEGHRWTEWFQLGMSAGMFKQRIFEPYAYGDKDRLAELRRRIHVDAYGVLGSFIRQAVDLQKVYTRDAEYKDLRGAIGELVGIALLNRCRPAIAGASISTAREDMLHSIDAIYRYYPNRGSVPAKLNLQVKTASETRLLSPRVLQVGLQNILDGPEDDNRAATLITKELAGGLSIPEVTELDMRSGMLLGRVQDAAKCLLHQANGPSVQTASCAIE